MVILDYVIDIKIPPKEKSKEIERCLNQDFPIQEQNYGPSEFRLSYYPHRLEEFTKILDETFPSGTKHRVFGDFKPLNEIDSPGFYIHVLEKPN